jgi:hypothetical protein
MGGSYRHGRDLLPVGEELAFSSKTLRLEEEDQPLQRRRFKRISKIYRRITGEIQNFPKGNYESRKRVPPKISKTLST